MSSGQAALAVPALPTTRPAVERRTAAEAAAALNACFIALLLLGMSTRRPDGIPARGQVQLARCRRHLDTSLGPAPGPSSGVIRLSRARHVQSNGAGDSPTLDPVSSPARR